jgi:IS30 family transposase
MPRDEPTIPRSVRDARIVQLARRHFSTREIAREVGMSHSGVAEVIRRQDPRYRRRRTDTDDDPSISDFYTD